MAKPKPNDAEDSSIPRSEREATLYEEKLDAYIKAHKGQYLKAEDGSIHLILGRQRIPLSYDRNNMALAKLMLDACNVSTLTQGAQAAIQRLQVKGHSHASAVRLERFSAFSKDHTRLYIPVRDDRLIVITAGKVEFCSNGSNQDHFWVEHPYQNACQYSKVDTRESLTLFEDLLVESQACAVPSMRWLVAMHEGFFPYVRNICGARFLLVHLGGTQQGKTSGAQRFTLLHGLGEVKGDFSVAALANSGDIGLLALDNKEQANFEQPLIDFCLFLATGAERGRSQTDGQVRTNSSRPVGVITSIEGVWKQELQARCVEVRYQIAGKRRDREDTEESIQARHSEIVSGMIPVLQAWLRHRAEGSQRFWDDCPLQNFERHLSCLAQMLCAYGEVAGKPDDWAARIVADWSIHLRQVRADEEDALEYPIKTILETARDEANAHFQFEQGVIFDSQVGTLCVTDAASMLQLLHKVARREDPVPKNSSGLARRLRSAHFCKFIFLDEERAPQLPQLKRTAKRRPIGFFEPNDDMTAE